MRTLGLASSSSLSSSLRGAQMLVAELAREADLPAVPLEPPTTAVPRTGFAEAGSTLRRQGEGLGVMGSTQ